MTELTTAARELAELQAKRDKEIADHESQLRFLSREISERQRILMNAEVGLDNGKIALAETILEIRGTYHPGYGKSESCVKDAIKQLATGEPIREQYSDLWRTYFGVKNYASWQGQRADCTYGSGPSHGSIVFSVGLNEQRRSAYRTGIELTAEETEAAIYYLTNLQRIQEAAQKSAA